jgi:superfamily II DNA or RNA helicase
VDGTTPKAERERILRDFKNGRFSVLCNVDILTTGYDEPSIECVVINRRTKSVPLWLQMCGRGSRIYRNKSEFIILDMGGNTIELGHWERVRTFSLWHKVGLSGGVAPQKQCPEGKIELNEDGQFYEVDRKTMKNEDLKKYGCGNFVPASAVICPDCGFIFPKSKRKMIESEFVEIGSDQKEFPAHLQKPLSQMNFDELLQVCAIKGYKKTWVLHNIEQTDANIRKFAEFMGYKKEWVFNYKKRLLNRN